MAITYPTGSGCYFQRSVQSAASGPRPISASACGQCSTMANDIAMNGISTR